MQPPPLREYPLYGFPTLYEYPPYPRILLHSYYDFNKWVDPPLKCSLILV